MTSLAVHPGDAIADPLAAADPEEFVIRLHSRRGGRLGTRGPIW